MLVNFNRRSTKEQKEEKEKEALWSSEIKKRDGYACLICGSLYRPCAHHLVPREHKEFKFDLDNGLTLCCKHHKFSRVISAHNNPMAFFLWLQKYRYAQFVTAVERQIKIASAETAL